MRRVTKAVVIIILVFGFDYDFTCLAFCLFYFIWMCVRAYWGNVIKDLSQAWFSLPSHMTDTGKFDFLLW